MNEQKQELITESLGHEQVITNLDPLDKIHKQIASAQGIAIFIAVVNFALGAAVTWIPPVGRFFDMDQGIGLVLFGLLYFGLSVGIGRKSRIATTVGFVFLLLDTVYSFVIRITQSDGAARFPITRVLLLGALLMGMIASFRFHKLKKENEQAEGEAIRALFARKPFFVSKKQFIFFAVFVVASGVTIAKGLLAPFPAVDVASWETFYFPDAGISMKTPGEMVPNVDHSPPEILSYEYHEGAVYLNMIMLQDMADPFMSNEAMAKDMARQILLDSLNDSLEDSPGLGGEGSFDGAPYYQAAGYDREHDIVGVCRLFSSRGNAYFAVLVMFGDPEDKQVQASVDAFYSSIERID